MTDSADTGRLPNLLIIGERRSGTTWLSQLIAHHPAIFVHPKRDRGYFIDDDARKRKPAAPWEETHNVADYRSMFRGYDYSPYTYLCEKSADHLFWRPAHERMARFLPDAKYIVILRHPVKRAWSHYWIEVGKGRETEEFATALALESERSRAQPYQHNHLSYRTRGFYDESFVDLLPLIPREQLHVTTLEQLVADRSAAMRGVFEFLGLPEITLPETPVEAQNRNWVMTPRDAVRAAGLSPVARGYASVLDFSLKFAVPDRDRRRRIAVALKSPLLVPANGITMDRDSAGDLAESFAPHVRRLENLLGQSFGHWGL